jgi:DNA mismatch repair protein MutL
MRGVDGGSEGQGGAGRIHRLSPDLVGQIAAGEVVERPASVVKELVENALDAEASRIEVSITEGGIRGLLVSDDGWGMSASDAALAFERHATSKIRTTRDLETVGTLGFRGEALPSIASVAAVRLRTRRAGEPQGSEVRIAPGEPLTVSACGTPPGTRVEVAELFAAVPARRKFLRSEATETQHVARWLERTALARPDVGFSMARNGRAVLELYPTRELRERVIAVLPPGVGERLLAVEGQDATASLYGFTSPTDLMRGDTAELHLFVNGRPVRDPLLLGAVREAYRDALPPGRHPVVALFLRIDPSQVDVNVHPAKSEVRFRDPAAVRQLLRRSLMGAIGRRPAPRGASPLFEPALPRGGASLLFDAHPSRSVESRETSRRTAEPHPRAGDEPAPARVPFAAHRYLGQALGTYLVLVRDDALVLVDQHAGHERVLFERMRQALLEGELPRQALLVPIWVELAPSAAEVLEKACPRLLRAGIELEPGERSPRGNARVTIRSIPAALVGRPLDWAPLLEETATALRSPEEGTTREGLEASLHALLASAACHAALRKGDRIAPEEARALLGALDDTLWVPNCPHGRPILHELSGSELERRFLRR